MKDIWVVAHYAKKRVSNKSFSGFKWIQTDEKEGKLHLLEKGDPTEPLQFWERKSNRSIELKELTRIQTTHSVDDGLGRGDMPYPAPLYDEVVKQIPKKLLKKVKAFKVLIDNFQRQNGYDTITTVLYTK